MQRMIKDPFSHDRPILVLLGMMGVGKSAVGVRLAARLALPFKDLDTLVENEVGLGIAECFSRYGEPEFRRLEARLLRACVEGAPCVLALGGGACMPPESCQILKQKTVTIWLKARFETLCDRLARHGERPLLAGKNWRARLKKLMEDRYPVYAEADFSLDTDMQSCEETVRKLEDIIRNIQHKEGNT